MIRFLAALVVACFLLVAPASAAEPAGLAGLVEIFRPVLEQLVNLLALALGAWLVKLFKDKLGIELAERQTAVFQTALTGAAGMYLKSKDLSRSLQVLHEGNHETVAATGLDDASLAEKILAKASVLTVAAAPASLPAAR